MVPILRIYKIYSWSVRYSGDPKSDTGLFWNAMQKPTYFRPFQNRTCPFFGSPLYLSYVLPEGHQSTQRNPDQLVEPGQTRPTLSQNYNKMTKHFLHHFWQGQTWRFGQSGMAVRRPGPRQRAARGGTAESGGWLYLRLFCREDRGTRSCRCRNSGDDGFEFADDPSQRCRRKMFSSWNNFIWMCSKELKNGTLNKGKILILGCYDIKVLDIEVLATLRSPHSYTF